MKLRVVVVDDEPLARRRLVSMLAEHADVDVVGEGEDVASAAAMLGATNPDLVLLDVQMPEVDGFALLERLAPGVRPCVVFVTAHAQHAVRAFEAGAIDYLLKPYDQRRLTKSLDRARTTITTARAAAQDAATGLLLAEVRTLVDTLRVAPSATSAPEVPSLASPASAPRYLERVAVTIGRRTVFVAVVDIEWIEADRNYLCLHTRERAYLVRSSVGAFEARLNPAEFVRVHRSAIVRLDRVRELRTLSPGVWRIVLVDGTEVAVSAPYRDRLARI